jgi:transaldolase
VGATCNPVIALAAIRARFVEWRERIVELAAEHPTATEAEIGWLVVEELSVRAAKLLEPHFWESGGRNGRLSIQTDPRYHRDPTRLVEQAEHFATLAPNIIVKIPATAAGIEAIEEATRRGISVNATVSFTVAQSVAVGEAIERGLEQRLRDGNELHELGSVVTIMGGRLDDWLKAWTDHNRILIEPGYLDWAGVAALKRAHSVFKERGFRSRVLSAAFRNYLQWSELQGGDLVVSPPFDWQLRIIENDIPAEDRIDVPVPPKILNSLLERVPEFRRAYEVDGLSIEEFETFGATVATLRQFLDANVELEKVVRDVLVPAR